MAKYRQLKSTTTKPLTPKRNEKTNQYVHHEENA